MDNQVIQQLQGIPFRGGPGFFGPGGYDTGVSVLSIVLRFTIWVLIVLAVVWVIREILGVVRGAQAGAPRARNSPALAELEMLYARGEVSRADYISRRADLTGVAPPTLPAA